MTTNTKPTTCPSWCDSHHYANELDPVESHSHVVLGRPTGDSYACVAIEMTDGEPVVFVELSNSMTVTPAQALRVSAALTDAVGIVSRS
jgi:hypothetical protein